MESSSRDIVLQEEIGADYEPTEQEVLEYAAWLDVDFPKHKELLWIAKESLTSPLPPDWKPCLTEEDEIYYFNFATGESLWNHPCDEFYRNVYKEKVRELFMHQESQLTDQAQRLQHAASNHSQAYKWNDKQLGSTCLLDSAIQLERSMSQSHQDIRGLVMPKNWAASSQDIAKDLIGSSHSEGSKSTNKSFSDPSLSAVSLYPLEKFITRSLPANQLSFINNNLVANKNYLRNYMSTCKSSCNLPFFQILAKRYVNGNEDLQGHDGVRDSELVQHSQQGKCSNFSKGIKENIGGEVAWEKQVTRQGIDAQVKHSGKDKEENKLTDDSVSCMQDRIKSKILEEEHIVLEQEHTEMIERVGQLVHAEEPQIHESLKQEMLNQMEKQLKSEAEAILADRRKKMYKEIEIELESERKLLLERRKMVDEEKIPVRVQAAKMQQQLYMCGQHEAFEEQLKLERDKQKANLENLFQKERDRLESAKQTRFQEMRKNLKEEESRLMEKGRQEIQKKVSKELEQEESNLFDNMRSKMEARIKQNVTKLEATAFEKEYELLVKRIRSQVEQKYKELLDLFKNQKDVKSFTWIETPSKQHEGKVLKNFVNFTEHEAPNDSLDSRQGFVEEKGRDPETQSITKEIQEMRKKLNAFRGSNATLTMQNEVNLKKQVSEFINELKDMSLQQMIREEILQLVQKGVLSVNIANNRSSELQKPLRMSLDSVPHHTS